MSAELRYGPKKRLLAFLLELAGFFLLKPLNLFRNSKLKSVRKILLIEPFQMGDIVALSALFEPLKSRYPEAQIFILGKKGPVAVARFIQEVDEVLDAPFPWSVKGEEKASWKDWFKTMWALRVHRFDLGIDVRGDVRSHLSLLLAGCGFILSYRRYIYSDIYNHGLLCNVEVGEEHGEHVFDKNRFLLTGLGFSNLELFPIRFPLFSLKGPGTKERTPKILLHIGSSWKYKMWPTANWAELAFRLKQELQLEPVLVAGPGESSLVDEILKQIPGYWKPEVLFPSLPQLLQLLAEAALLVGGDSGPMCIANCLDTPRLAIFGPGLPSVWEPYQKPHLALQDVKGYTCYPCIQKTCFHPDQPCTSRISVSHVLNTLTNHKLA